MQLIPLPLPHPVPPTRWITVTDEIRATKAYWPAIEKTAMDTARKPGWNPKTVQMAGKMMAIDYCFIAGDKSTVHSYNVAVIEDHPFLATLPTNAPRAVKHIYRKQVRMKYLMAGSAFDFMQDMWMAKKAAEEYNKVLQGDLKNKEAPVNITLNGLPIEDLLGAVLVGKTIKYLEGEELKQTLLKKEIFDVT